MTFSQKVKEEITQLEFSDHCAKAILSSYLKNSLEININSEGITWEIVSQSPFILRFIYKYLNILYEVDKKFFYSNKRISNKSRLFKMILKGDLNIIEKDLKIFDSQFNFDNDCCKRAYVAGLFLSGGSVNSPTSKTYHLEFSIKNKDVKNSLEKILKEIKIEPKFLFRKEKYILYIKKSNLISDILKFISAQNSMFEYEDKRISKDFSNQVHRLNNLDLSNLKKTVNAASDQLKYINWIINNKKEFEKLSDNEKKICKLRLKNKDLSLQELSNKFNSLYMTNLSKSAIYHYIKKIKKIYENRIL